MKYCIARTTQFKRDYKAVKKRGYDVSLLKKIVTMLADNHSLPVKYCDHALTGKYSDTRECHITPDWLLIYQINEELLILTLSRTGSHSDLF